MKFTTFLFLSILLSSCEVDPSKHSSITQEDEDWRISIRSVTRQTYNSHGLPDTSFETVYSYKMEIPADSAKSIIVRQYDGNNRNVNEKDLLIFPDGSDEVSSETIKKFDINGNELLVISKFEGAIEYQSSNEYNTKNQLVRKIELNKKRVEVSPTDTAGISNGHVTKIQPQYDTSVTSYQYDENGNQIGSMTSTKEGSIINSIFTQYAGSDKISKIRRNSDGDTVSQSIYKHSGDLIMQITNDKEFGNSDTVWFKSGKIIKIIGHNYKKGTKHKIETTYNDKGDQIESFSYR